MCCLKFVFQFFLAPPECCPNPRWYSLKFSSVYESFSASTKSVGPNIRLLPLYKMEQNMFELDGRHLLTPFGKDYLDRLLYHADQGMVIVDLDTDLRASASENRLTVVENRVDLVRRDLGRAEQRLNVAAARASEDGDAVANEK